MFFSYPAIHCQQNSQRLTHVNTAKILMVFKTSNILIRKDSLRSTGYGLDGPEFESQHGQGGFSFPNPFLNDSRAHEAFNLKWVPGFLPPGVKLPKHELDRSPPSSTETKNNEWSDNSTGVLISP